MKNHQKTLAGHASAHSRDGPIIFHMRDGPPSILGPPGGTGPPDIYVSGTGPPKTTGPPMEWLVKKKSLKKSRIRKYEN
ncbi:MAG: hypothetical protein IMF17_06755 [Proteobacteria bacterium]|nr:hypothetical protein [Pseudomonadota bacterium]